MRKCIWLIIMVFIVGCSKEKDITTIPGFVNNYKNGSYEYVAEYPHMDVLKDGCDAYNDLGYCETLKEEYAITKMEEQDYSAILVDEEDPVRFDFYYTVKDENVKYEWAFNRNDRYVGKELFNSLINNINVEVYYPTVFRPNYNENPSKVIQFGFSNYTEGEVYYIVDIRLYDSDTMGYVEMRGYRNTPISDSYEEVLAVNAFADVSKLIELLNANLETAEETIPFYEYPKEQDFTSIPAFIENFKSGEYQHVDTYPRVNVKANGCEVGKYLEMSNYMDCTKLTREYDITSMPKQEYSDIYMEVDRDLSIQYYIVSKYGDEVHNNWNIKNGKEIFNELVESISNEVYYPSIYQPSYNKKPSNYINLFYEVDGIKYNVTINLYDSDTRGYVSFTIGKNSAHYTMNVHCYADVSKVIEMLFENFNVEVPEDLRDPNVEKNDFTKIPAFAANYSRGSYEYVDTYPHVEVLASGCEVGEYIPMSNWRNCTKLAEKYEITEMPVQDYSDIYMKEEDNFSMGYTIVSENVEDSITYSWDIENGKELFNSLIDAIEDEVYYPKVFRPNYNKNHSNYIGMYYEIDDIGYSVGITIYENEPKGYVEFTIGKNSATYTMDINCYADVSKIIEILSSMTDSAKVSKPMSECYG